ncbi:hypothetical protein QEN19_000334 [Hanseniaspora menglaensis]
MNSFSPFIAPVNLNTTDSNFSDDELKSNIDLNVSISSILKSNIEVYSDDDDRLSLLSESFDDDTDDDNWSKGIYKHLPLNKNSKYNTNLSSSNNTQKTILLSNYKANILKDGQIPTNEFLKENEQAHSALNSVSRPNSAKLKTLGKKIHIEDIIDNASISNTHLEKTGYSRMPLNLKSTFAMSNITSELSTMTTNTDFSANDLQHENLNLDKHFFSSYPLLDNFTSSDALANSLEHFIQRSITKNPLLKQEICKKHDIKYTRDRLNNNYKKDLSNENGYYFELFQQSKDEIAAILIEKVEARAVFSGKNGQQDLLPEIYNLNEPTLTFNRFMRERVCVHFDAPTLIFTIKQLDKNLKNILIKPEKQHKFIFALVKYNYKLNNDIASLSMKSFVKISGLNKGILKNCELELIRFLFCL